jgi:hypothetical protein
VSLGENAVGNAITSGGYNFGAGFNSGMSITSGSHNQFVGYRAGYNTTSGARNIAIGSETLYANQNGDKNVAIGYATGYSSNGFSNVLLGDSAGYYVNGNNAVAIGSEALKYSKGDFDVAIGNMALRNHTTNGSNIALGASAMMNNSTGYGNIAIGRESGRYLTEGSSNIFIGASAGTGNSGGFYGQFNTVVGDQAAIKIGGNYNTIMGHKAGYNTTGSYNVMVGYGSGYNETGSNKLYIHNNGSVTPLIYGEFDNSLLKVNGNLDVIGDINTTGEFRVNGTTVALGGSSVFTDNTTHAFYNQNLGIGISDPLERVEIAGAVRLGNSVSNAPGTIRWNGTEIEYANNSGQWISMGGMNPGTGITTGPITLLLESDAGSGLAVAATTWQTRPLNTVASSGVGFDTLYGDGSFSLLPGQYIIKFMGAARLCDYHQARVVDMTHGNTTVAVGNADKSATAGNNTGYISGISQGTGMLTVTSPTVFRLEHYTQSYDANGFLGTSASNGENVVHSYIEIMSLDALSGGGDSPSLWTKVGINAQYLDGGIRIGNTGTNAPGMIRWNGGDLEVADNSGQWLSLTSGGYTTHSSSPEGGDDFYLLAHTTTTGVNGGVATTGWNVRPLNLMLDGNAADIPLTGTGNFTLKPGSYHIRAKAHSYRAQRTRLRLKNITNSDYVAYGPSLFNDSTAMGDLVFLSAMIDVTTTATFQLEHYFAMATGADNQLGVAVSDGTTEIHTLIEIWDESDDHYDGGSSAGAFQVVSGNAEFNTGNVGIGIPNPQERLELGGALRLGGSLSNNPGTIRWNGADLEVANNSGQWLSLTSGTSGTGTGSALDSIAIIADVKPNSVNGGTFTSGSWQTRQLTQMIKPSPFMSHFGDRFVLMPGDYLIEFKAPAFKVNRHVARLWNATDSMVATTGTISYTGNAADNKEVTFSEGIVAVSLSIPTSFEVQHLCQDTSTTHGFGPSIGEAVTSSEEEIYTVVKVTDLKANAGGSDSQAHEGSAVGSIILGDDTTNDTQGDFSAILGGQNNQTYGDFSSVAGGQWNTAAGFKNFIGAGQTNVSSGMFSSIVGGQENSVNANHSIIAGGSGNSIDGPNSFIGAGDYNAANGQFNFIGSGQNNLVNSNHSSVVGGYANTASAHWASVLGGYANNAGGDKSVVGGGFDNHTLGTYAGVLGGDSNWAKADFSSVVGGSVNTAEGNYSFIGAGSNNVVTSTKSAIVGGGFNKVTKHASFVGGGEFNEVHGVYSAIVGGQDSWIVTGTHNFIGSGHNNFVANGDHSFIGGGTNNRVNGNDNTVSGGSSNGVTGIRGFIGGGVGNGIITDYGTIGGGWFNNVTGHNSSILGGAYNSNQGGYSFIGAGSNNLILSGTRASIAGGQYNTASADYAFIGGGKSNQATAPYAFVPGGHGADAFQHGQMAHASGFFTKPGDIQGSFYILRNSTNTNNSVDLYLDGTSQTLVMKDNTSMTYWGYVTARSDSGLTAAWKIEGMLKRAGGPATTSSPASPTLTTIDDSELSAASILIGPDTTNGGLMLNVTGVNATNIRWGAKIHTMEISY